jgi:hypothetical protein
MVTGKMWLKIVDKAMADMFMIDESISKNGKVQLNIKNKL